MKGEITKEQEKKIYKAHDLKMSTRVAAEYARVSSNAVSIYWKKKGLKPHKSKYFKRPKDEAGLTILIDNIFDTKNKPDETLSFDDIKEKLNKSKISFNESKLKLRISYLVKIGFYDRIYEDGVKKYKAGMPAAMKGSLEEKF